MRLLNPRILVCLLLTVATASAGVVYRFSGTADGLNEAFQLTLPSFPDYADPLLGNVRAFWLSDLDSCFRCSQLGTPVVFFVLHFDILDNGGPPFVDQEIGRASCRERV